MSQKKYEQGVILLFQQGQSQSEIARKIGIGRTSMRRILSRKQ